MDRGPEVLSIFEYGRIAALDTKAKARYSECLKKGRLTMRFRHKDLGSLHEKEQRILQGLIEIYDSTPSGPALRETGKDKGMVIMDEAVLNGLGQRKLVRIARRIARRLIPVVVKKPSSRTSRTSSRTKADKRAED